MSSILAAEPGRWPHGWQKVLSAMETKCLDVA
jgi:hypothetical protein